MYNRAEVPAVVATGGGTLAATGGHVTWMLLAGFAMIALGAALLRIVPRGR